MHVLTGSSHPSRQGVEEAGGGGGGEEEGVGGVLHRPIATPSPPA